jgi:chitodextrinase
MFRKKVKLKKIIRLKAIKDVSRFSVWHLAVFVLVFVSIGSFMVYHGYAYLSGDPPTAPTSLTISFVNSSEVQLSWRASSSEAASTLYYSIYRNNTLVTTTTALTYYNSGLSASTTYTYYVTAHDQFGTSPASNSVSITTPAPPPPPSPVSAPTLYAQAVSYSEIDLNWSASSSPGGISGYNIFRNSILIASVDSTSYNSYKNTGLSASMTYSYFVTAYSVYGTSPASNTVSATTLAPPPPPTTPSNLSAETLDDSEIDLSWTASTSTGGISRYNIYRNGSFIGSTSSATVSDTGSLTAYYDNGLASATTYSYYVVAVSSSGIASSPSSAISTMTQSTTPPSAPKSFKATVTSASTVSLSWTASTLGQVGLKEYDVYEVIPPDDTDDNGVLDGQLIASTSGTSYQVTGLSASTSYGFYVIAVDTTDNFSDQSAEGLATTNAPGYALSVGLSATLTDIGNSTTGTVINTAISGSYQTCAKKFDSDGSAKDSSWSGSFSGITSYSQTVYPPSSSAFYTFYSYELSCTNGASTAVSGIAVRKFSDDVTN